MKDISEKAKEAMVSVFTFIGAFLTWLFSSLCALWKDANKKQIEQQKAINMMTDATVFCNTELPAFLAYDYNNLGNYNIDPQGCQYFRFMGCKNGFLNIAVPKLNIQTNFAPVQIRKIQKALDMDIQRFCQYCNNAGILGNYPFFMNGIHVVNVYDAGIEIVLIFG